MARDAPRRSGGLLTLEGLGADVTVMRPTLLVLAGHVAEQRALLREALLAELAVEGPLARVGAVVLVQAGCRGKVTHTHTR